LVFCGLLLLGREPHRYFRMVEKAASNEEHVEFAAVRRGDHVGQRRAVASRAARRVREDAQDVEAGTRRPGKVIVPAARGAQASSGAAIRSRLIGGRC